MSVFRVRFDVARPGVGYGETRYYEDERQMLVDVLEAHLSVENEKARGYAKRMLHGWQRLFARRSKRKLESGVWRVTKIEEHVDNEWRERNVDIVEPSITLREIVPFLGETYERQPSEAYVVPFGDRFRVHLGNKVPGENVLIGEWDTEARALDEAFRVNEVLTAGRS